MLYTALGILLVCVVIGASIGVVLLRYRRTKRRQVQAARVEHKSAIPAVSDNSGVKGRGPLSIMSPTVQIPVGLGSEAELERLRLKVWRSRRRRVKLMGRIYLIGGLASLVAGYRSGYLAFEVTSVILIPLGVFFTFTGTEPYVKSSMAAKSVISTMRVLQEALKANSDEGHAIFVPGDKEPVNVMMFIPETDTSDGSIPSLWRKGHFYTPLGHDLFQAYLKEAGGRTEKTLPLLLDQLRTITTSALELYDDVKFEVNHSEIDVNIKNTTFAEIGRFPELVRDVYAKAGCPVTNSIAEWISYGTKSKVRWVDAKIDPISRSASVRLFLISSG